MFIKEVIETATLYLHVEDRYIGRIVKHTLNVYDYKVGRRIGNTTRQINAAIEMLFNDTVVVCFDHHNFGTSRTSNERLADLIMRRLKIEHQVDMKYIKFDKNLLTLQLKFT